MRWRRGSTGLLTLALILGASPLLASSTSATPGLAPCSQRYVPVGQASPSEARDPEQALKEGFAATRLWGVDNFSVSGDAGHAEGRVLSVDYPAGTSSPSDSDHAGVRGGGGFYAAPPGLSGSERACLQYRLRFPGGFDFVKGGKLPGLYGGDAPSGGRQADGHNGFSMRFMWREAGQGELYAYVVEPQGDYGVSLGRGRWDFPTGEWLTLEQELILNAPGRSDGVARVWVNGELVFAHEELRYRETETLGIDGLMFSTFFGGTGPSWRTPRDQRVDFADFRFYRPAS
ncbi:polysaccharide lyase [Halomonas saccharevitans]|uniref:Polysaccharide lyase 14 domain-containing protein n=1 Tax=Halomonas saccharevitans TaxID=416872 RepID=A0A1I6Z2H6_9GAMM|nr:hypothetical protein [Halomonas saccharevitans]SFT56882.1 hypothetical protein SAMN04487956_10884 [Halomonas saccharevitans]